MSQFPNSKVAMDGIFYYSNFCRNCICWYFVCRKNGGWILIAKRFFDGNLSLFVCVNFAITSPTKNNGAFDIVPLVTFPYWIWKICRSKDCPRGWIRTFSRKRPVHDSAQHLFLLERFFFWLHFEEVGLGNAWFVFMLGICFRYFNAKHRSEVSANKSRTLCLIHTTWVFSSTC